MGNSRNTLDWLPKQPLEVLLQFSFGLKSPIINFSIDLVGENHRDRPWSQASWLHIPATEELHDPRQGA